MNTDHLDNERKKFMDAMPQDPMCRILYNTSDKQSHALVMKMKFQNNILKIPSIL